jgi:hypothetical protein
MVAEREALDEEKARMAGIHAFQKSKVRLDVGGHRYTTALATLTSIPESFLARMFSGDYSMSADEEDGSYFVDRDGRHFHCILNYLRDPSAYELPSDLLLLKDLLKETEYFGIVSLCVSICASFSCAGRPASGISSLPRSNRPTRQRCQQSHHFLRRFRHRLLPQ